MRPATQPILVMPVYRGGERFERALRSIPEAEKFFERIIISINGPEVSADMGAARNYVYENGSKAEIICTQQELPWMEHQYFWMDHLERSGVESSNWIYWFAHDDEIRSRGIANLVNEELDWPLEQGVTYLGAWGMRHEQGDQLFEGSRTEEIEYWTSFPVAGPTRLPVANWISQQMIQPTYINMSGCVTTFKSFQSIRDFRIPKPGGMRIEMAVAAAPHNEFVAEFDDPIVITYGRPNSDRTQYAKVVRQDDKHILAWLVNYAMRHPAAIVPLAGAGLRVASTYAQAALVRKGLPEEDWRVRGVIQP